MSEEGGRRNRSLEKVLMEEDVDHTRSERKVPPKSSRAQKIAPHSGPVFLTPGRTPCASWTLSFLGFKEQKHRAVFSFESQLRGLDEASGLV